MSAGWEVYCRRGSLESGSGYRSAVCMSEVIVQDMALNGVYLVAVSESLHVGRIDGRAIRATWKRQSVSK